MYGLMMNTPLSITSIMKFAAQHHAEREVVSVTHDQPIHRCTYGQLFERVQRLAAALNKFGIKPGDRIATLAWNDHRHMEIYYAVSCFGAVCHTINPRLFEEQIAYIVNHAEDRLIFVDVSFVPMLEKLADRLDGVARFVVLTDDAHMPQTSLKNATCYEEMLAGADADFDWPELDEDSAAALCYTSGTTGNPKGVLYSHRSTVLHAWSICLPDVLGLSARDCVMPIVPMFHACAWGMPYAAPMTGAKLVLPGPKLADGELLQTLIEQEGVTAALGVPTVWLALLQYLADSGSTVESLNRVVVGGAACPPSVIREFDDNHGVYVHHAWGMTETSPLGTFNTLKPEMEVWPKEQREATQSKQGRCVFGIEMKITGDDDNELPWDGESAGTLKVRGPFVASGYYSVDDAGRAPGDDGWFDTGDVATIDADGFMHIVDRTKDLIKSGGEWISSIELENAAFAHPEVMQAAVIAVSDPKWGERPLLVAVQNDAGKPSKEELLEWLAGKVAKWWIPDDVRFIEQLPLTATGKVNKRALRSDPTISGSPDVERS